jgi:L-glutamine-phosphate cytidylyltransferase
MRAIILAAGRGSRLHPYTANCPKCLTELGGQSLIARQLATLRGAGVDDIVIATGYRREMLALPETRQVHNALWDSTNMVESLFCAEAGFGNDVIVTYADIVYEPRVLAALLDSPHDVSVVVDRNWRAYWEHRFSDPLSDAESLSMDSRGCIADIGNPVSDIDTIEAQYMGLMRFRGAGVDALRAARANLDTVSRPWMEKRSVTNAYMTDLLMEMILMGRGLHAVPVEGGWLEIDTVEDYERAAQMIADGSVIRFFDPATTPFSG